MTDIKDLGIIAGVAAIAFIVYRGAGDLSKWISGLKFPEIKIPSLGGLGTIDLGGISKVDIPGTDKDILEIVSSVPNPLADVLKGDPCAAFSVTPFYIPCKAAYAAGGAIWSLFQKEHPQQYGVTLPGATPGPAGTAWIPGEYQTYAEFLFAQQIEVSREAAARMNPCSTGWNIPKDLGGGQTDLCSLVQLLNKVKYGLAKEGCTFEVSPEGMFRSNCHGHIVDTGRGSYNAGVI